MQMKLLTDNSNFLAEFSQAITKETLLVFNYTEEEGLTIRLKFLPIKLKKQGFFWMVDGYLDGIKDDSNYRQLYVSNCGYKNTEDMLVSSIKAQLPIMFKSRNKYVRRIFRKS